MSPALRRPARIAGTGAPTVGVLMLIWVVVVWRWQDPFTAIQTYFSQKHLRTTYAQRSATFERKLPVKPPANPAAAWHEAATAARLYSATLTTGGPVGRLMIGRLGLDIYVV